MRERAATAVRVPAPRPPGTGVVPLDAALEETRADLARTDTIATALVGFAGVLLTVLAAGVSLAGEGAVPAPARVATVTAALALAASLLPLGASMFPRRGQAGGAGGGVPHFARRTPAQVLRELGAVDAAQWQASRIAVLARITDRKHACLRWAIGLIVAGGLALAVSVLLTLAL